MWLFMLFFSIRRPTVSTRADTPVPYTTVFRSDWLLQRSALPGRAVAREGGGAVTRCLGSGRSGGARAAREPRFMAIRRLVRGTRARYARARIGRSEEHTSELQSLMRIPYAVFCLTKKIITNNKTI